MKYKVPACIVAILAMPFLMYAQTKATSAAEKTVNETNYSIIPKLPPAPKPEPFTVSTIPLPDTVVLAILVNYLPDGKHLIAEVELAGSTYHEMATINEDGSEFKCLTCGLKEKVGGEMPVPLPDGKRIYTPTGILECSPSILDCKEARILPLVYPKIPGDTILWRIASNMSPDGIHVAGTLVTRHGGLVLVSELTRISDDKGDRYELKNAKVIAGDKMDTDPSGFRISAAGGGEVKSFAGRGRYLITSSVFESNNFDLAKIDLTTGEITRLTKHFSYDEGTYPSSDGEWVVFQTHRQTTRMDAFGLIPRPMIAGLPQAGGVAYQRNAEFEGYLINPRRFYGLTMVDKYGDRARLPEDGYTGQNLTTAKDNFVLYNHFGNFSWDPTSTHGVFWEQKDPKHVKAGERQGRLRMIRFTSRKPSTPLAPFSPDIKWATDLENIKWSNMATPEQGTLKGLISGYAEISTQKPAPGSTEQPRRVTRYFDYSDDGVCILNGNESTTTGGTFGRETSWDADIKVTGKRKGFLKAQDVKFRITKMSSGTIQAQLGTHKIDVDLAKGLPTGVPGELR